MILLIVFAFIAGLVTILSPCILPVLPIVLSSSLSEGKKRPFGIVTGFVLSFTFFTLFLTTLVKLTGISADSLRIISVIVIFTFGLSLVSPKIQILFEQLFNKLSSKLPTPQKRDGFWGGILVGLSLGLLWTPCVGPILASVISLAITGSISLNAVLITFAYSLGTAIPMFLIIYTGRNIFTKFPWLLKNTGRIQKAFGIIMMLTAIGIFFNLDRRFQTWVITTFPKYGVGLTKFEEVGAVKKELEKLQKKPVEKTDIGKPMYNLLEKDLGLAPEIIPGGRWFNSPPLKLADFRGKVVIIDFWTYTCINCQRTLPYLKNWYAKYKDKGLVIIGVHAPEFEFEKNPDNVAKAIKDFGLEYPIIQDNNFATWIAYNNNAWPAKYFIDKNGKIRWSHFGEGAYDESERLIQKLLSEMGQVVTEPINNPKYQNYDETRETYLGYDRIQYFVSPETVQPDKTSTYTIPANIPKSRFAYGGKWMIGGQYSRPDTGAKLILNFTAKEVFLVMRPKNNIPGKIKVLVNGQIISPDSAGKDVKNGLVEINADRLYTLINLKQPGDHLLELEFLDANLELYAFTFG